MPDLLRKPFGPHGEVHRITPASAGWRYVGFSLHCLRAGETATDAPKGARRPRTPPLGRERILVMVEGRAAPQLALRPRPGRGMDHGAGCLTARRERDA